MAPMRLLVGKKVRLRALEPGDVELLYRWENDPRLWAVSETLAPFSRETIRQFIEDQRHDIYRTRQMRLIISRIGDGDGAGASAVVSTPDEPVGMVDLFDFDPVNLRAGVGIAICGDENRRKGYASEALDLVCGYAEEVLRLHGLWCSVAADNIPSIRLFSGRGFANTGIRREWSRRGAGHKGVRSGGDGWMDEVFFQRIFA